MKTYTTGYALLLAVLFLFLFFNCKKEALKVAPTVTITEATNITANSATVGSTITADGGSEVLSRGVCWNISGNPSTADYKTTNGKGMGSFSSSLTSLSPGTTYNLKSYATNAIGTAYSSQTSFKTLALLATLTTTEASIIASTSLNSGGNITNDGGAEVTSRGVCWSTTQIPTIADSKTTDGSGTGIYTSSITGLTPGTTYYIRSYSNNSIGTAYGNEITAITLATLPTLTTTDLSLVTSTIATSGGNITNDGGAAITARGVCWSTNQTPTIADNKTSDASGKGVFTSSITGLTPGSTYYFRAYATNSLGTAYGNQITSTTTPILPTVATAGITKITALSAVSGGNITNDGGAPIIARGVCWGLSQTPTATNSKTTDGTGKDSFVSSLTQLASGTSYYVRSYATNSVGTSYGEAVAFKTVIPSTQSDIKPTGLIPSTDSEINQIPTIGSIDPSSILSLKSGTILPSTYSIIVPPVENQGSNNSCVGFAMGYGMMSYTFGTFEAISDFNGQDRLYSPNYIWNQLNNGENKGISYYSAINLLKTQGCCKLTDMGISSNYSDQPSVTAKSHASDYKITNYYRFTKSDIDNDLLKTFLSKNYPIAIGMEVDDGFQLNDNSQFEKQSDGRLVWKAYKDNARYGHAMLICGYDDAIHAYKVLNSWSNRWGNNGFCWIDYDFFKTAVQGSFLSFNREVFVGLVMRPRLSTNDISGVTSNSAVCGGTITSDSGLSPSESKYAITSRGVCYSKMANPTILDDKTSDGTGIGTFTSTLIGLDADRMYYVKAFAINSEGVSYGYQKSFVTSKGTNSPTVTTTVASSITTNSAICGGNVTSDGGSAVTSRGVCWSTTQNPTTSNTKTTDGMGIGGFTSSITGLSSNTTYHLRAYATNNFGTAYGDDIIFKTISSSGSTVTDIDGNTYATVNIGTQVWMAENLKVTKLNDNTELPQATDSWSWFILNDPGYCFYDNSPTNKNIYGVLYNGYAVNTMKLCPSNWHVPTDSEWTTLVNYLGGKNIAGGKLKEKGIGHWADPNTGATNETGFTALPGGNRSIFSSNFYSLGKTGLWWTSTAIPSLSNYAWLIYFDSARASQNINSSWTEGLSVRCVKD